MTEVSAELVEYMAKRHMQRADAVAQLLTGLTEREQKLVKEAAVMGWVQGMRHHDVKYPGDWSAFLTVMDAFLGFPDLYPTITGYQPSED